MKITNILLNFLLITTPLFLMGSKDLEEQLKLEVSSFMETIPGWCSNEKAALIINTIINNKCVLCVDIGTFAGKSLFSIIQAVKYQKTGKIIGIDSWDSQIAIENLDGTPQDKEWWKNLDYDDLYRRTNDLVKKTNLESDCIIFKQTSESLVSSFEDNSIDFIHFDGSHKQEEIFNNIMLYYPKIKDGGFILLNDSNWLCMGKSLVFLLEHTQCCTPFSGAEPFILFQKNSIRHSQARSLLNRITQLKPLIISQNKKNDAVYKSGKYPLFFWVSNDYETNNFGDELSPIIIEKITGKKIKHSTNDVSENQRLFAIGSVLHFATQNDIIWGSGFRENTFNSNDLLNVNIKSVRGPKTRTLLLEKGISCPEVYGDPALLIGKLFPELKSQEKKYDYVIIPNIGEMQFFSSYKNIVLPTEDWQNIIKKITASNLVISSSLHGIIVAESYGIPARMLRMTNTERLLKYEDYYESTNRPHFKYASSVQEAIEMGGEEPGSIDLAPLIRNFPWEHFEIVNPEIKIQELLNVLK